MIELIGWIGAIGLLFAFIASSLGKLDNQGRIYHLINLICAGLLIVNAYVNAVYPFVVINTFWGIASLFILIRGKAT